MIFFELKRKKPEQAKKPAVKIASKKPVAVPPRRSSRKKSVRRPTQTLAKPKTQIQTKLSAISRKIPLKSPAKPPKPPTQPTFTGSLSPPKAKVT